MQCRDDTKRECDSNSMCGRFRDCARQEPQGWLNQMGERRLTNPAQRQTCHSDPQLRRGNECVELIQGPLNGDGTRIAFRHQLIDSRSAHTDQGKFSRHEKTIQQD
jgi:hypothetical protein